MKIALFLNVDTVLTYEPINLQYAKLLGVETESADIEKDFYRGLLSNEEYNDRFIPLFRKSKLTKDFIDKNIDKIRMRANSEEVLYLIPEATYFISSGPDFFVTKLAEKYNISSNHIICSRYDFDKNGLISKCTDAIGPMDKLNYVKSFSSEYDLSIGVSYSPEFDSIFLGSCDIKILLDNYRSGYLCVKDLNTIAHFLKNVLLINKGITKRVSDKFIDLETGIRKLLSKSSYEKNVFIMTPFREDARYRELIRTIKQELNKNDLKGWLASDLKLHSQLWSNVQCFMHGCKRGVAIFARDEIRRGKKILIRDNIYNPNVSIEAGYMLSFGKDVLVLKDKELKSLPVDIIGSLYENFDLDQSEETVRAALQNWIKELEIK